MNGNRFLSAFLVVVALASCGGRDPQQVERAANTLKQPRTVELPSMVSTIPAFRARFQNAVDPQTLARLGKIEDVKVIAQVRTKDLKVGSPKGPRSVRVAVVDALEFRPVAPQATGAADFVWTSLLAGEVVASFDAAAKLGVASGGTLMLPGYGKVQVGAVADNAIPNFADLVVDISIGQSIGVGPPTTLVIGAKPGADLTNLRTRLRRVPGITLHALVPKVPAAPDPAPVGTAEGSLIGSMRYRILKSGFIEPDPAWVAANIGIGNVPILGEVTCHRLVFPQLGAALAEVEEAGLGELIDRRQFGGCYVPRFIGRDPSRSLSMHAFGLAVDLNVAQNLYGTRGQMDPSIVAIFEKWGFRWGGRWSPPDPMHFEVVRLVQP